MRLLNLGATAIVLFALISTNLEAATVVWPSAGLSTWSTYYTIYTDVFFTGAAGVDMYLDVTSSSAATLEATSITAGAGSRWFEVSYNSAVDAQAVADADFFANAYIFELGSINIWVDQIFYMGFMLQGPDDIYGWASLVWDGNELTLVDSAAETTGIGIYAGTYTAVPEPSSAVLAMLGLCAFALRRKRFL